LSATSCVSRPLSSSEKYSASSRTIVRLPGCGMPESGGGDGESHA
jgi:hypothetical protein